MKRRGSAGVDQGKCRGRSTSSQLQQQQHNNSSDPEQTPRPAAAQRRDPSTRAFQVRRSVGCRRALARHACATRSTGRARSHRAQRPRRCLEVCGSCSRPPRRRSHSLAASRLARFDRHHHLSSQALCRDTRARSFAGRPSNEYGGAREQAQLHLTAQTHTVHHFRTRKNSHYDCGFS